MVVESQQASQVSDTVLPVVRSDDLDTIKQALRDAVKWQDSLADAWWNGVPSWQRGEENRKQANDAVKQRNKYAAILKSLSAPNPPAHREPTARTT